MTGRASNLRKKTSMEERDPMKRQRKGADRLGFLLLVSALLLLFSCVSTGTSKDIRVSAPRVKRLEQGAYSLLRAGKTRFRLYTDAVSFAKDYAQIHSGTIPRPDPPKVNFGRYLVAAAYMGRRSTAGYSIDLVPSMVDTPKESAWLSLTVLATEPPADALTAQVLTSPYVLLKIPRNSWKGIHFRDTAGEILAGLPVAR